MKTLDTISKSMLETCSIFSLWFALHMLSTFADSSLRPSGLAALAPLKPKGEFVVFLCAYSFI